MSNLDGNPHYNWDWSHGLVLHHDDPQGEVLAAQVDATLALAYEQRTANLIAAYATMIPKQYGEPIPREQQPIILQIRDDINERLGIEVAATK